MTSEQLDIFRKIPTLYTERLHLRKIDDCDCDDMFEYSKKPEVSRFLLWYPHRDRNYTKNYIKYLKAQYNRKKYYDWALVLRQGGKMIGTCGFTSFDLDNNSAEIGYVLNSDYWRKGYAAEGARRVLEFGFRELGLHRICVRILDGNDGSIRVAEKLGMKHEATHVDALIVKGEYRTYHVYSVLRDEFERL